MGMRFVLFGILVVFQYDVKLYVFEEVEMDCCCVLQVVVGVVFLYILGYGGVGV